MEPKISDKELAMISQVAEHSHKQEVAARRGAKEKPLPYYGQEEVEAAPQKWPHLHRSQG